MDWIFLPMLMVYTTFGEKKWRELLRGCLCLYLAAVLLGGMIHVIWENTMLSRFWQMWMVGSDAEAISVWLLALAMLGGVAAIELGRRYRELSCKREKIQEVVLYAGESQIMVKALWDSGNQLRDPYSGNMVHIVEASALKQLLGDGVYQYLMCYTEQAVALADPQEHLCMEQQEHLSSLSRVRLIPCRSLGSAHTMLTVFSITKMRLANGVTLTEPLIGLSPIPLSEDGSYEMLLHSQTDEMRRNQ